MCVVLVWYYAYMCLKTYMVTTCVLFLYICVCVIKTRVYQPFGVDVVMFSGTE